MLSPANALELADSPGPLLLAGKGGIFHLSHIWQARLNLRGRQVFTIDCALRFNAFYLAEEARHQGIQAEAMLGSILVQRAFTPYQILDVVYGIKDKDRVYFLLAPLKQFFDADVAEEESRFLLKKLLEAVARLKSTGVPLLIIEKNQYNHPNFAPAFDALRRVAESVIHLEENPEGLALRPEKIDPAQTKRLQILPQKTAAQIQSREVRKTA